MAKANIVEEFFLHNHVDYLNGRGYFSLSSMRERARYHGHILEQANPMKTDVHRQIMVMGRVINIGGRLSLEYSQELYFDELYASLRNSHRHADWQLRQAVAAVERSRGDLCPSPALVSDSFVFLGQDRNRYAQMNRLIVDHDTQAVKIHTSDPIYYENSSLRVERFVGELVEEFLPIDLKMREMCLGYDFRLSRGDLRAVPAGHM